MEFYLDPCVANLQGPDHVKQGLLDDHRIVN